MTSKPNFLASGAMGIAAGVAIAGGLVMALQMPAVGQSANSAAQYGSSFERPYGYAPGQESQPFEASTRDVNGNRVIVDGVMQTGQDLSTLSFSSGSASAWAQSSAGAGFNGPAQSTAIGNQINVITQGSFNTVIVNSTQTNSGNQNAALNGGISLND